MQNFKKCMPALKLLLVKNWGKNGAIMTTLHYHRLYQISSLEANLSLEDMKQLCHRQKPHSHR